jgi:Peptidase family M23
LPDRIPYPPLVISLGVGALLIAALALIPRRRVQVATNVLVAIGTVFLAIQLVRIYTPPADPVAIDPPLAGEWAMLAGGRSALISHHYRTPIVSNAVDFVRLDEEGHNGDPKMEKAWYGFGEPVLSPADGTVVSVTDIHPDQPVGNIGQNPSTGNHILLDIGGGHYAVLAHLQQGSARVSEGERVRLGQQIAAVGDSGDSLVPHLHLQVQDSPDFGEHVRTVPIVFRNVVLIRAGRESTPAEADLRRGDHIRRIGD